MKHAKTTTFLLELPLGVDAGQAHRLHAHFEVARCFYNNMLGEARQRLQKMRSDPAWRVARAIPRSQKVERGKAFSHLRQQYQFSEYDLHTYATTQRVSWLADHLDSTMAQTIATRAFQAVNRICLGKGKRVRFRSRSRGIDSVEGKSNKTGLRFVLQDPKEGNAGWLVWGNDRLAALIEWNDPVVRHGLKSRIKYARLIRRKASSPRAQGADQHADRYSVQLVLEGEPLLKPKNQAGRDIIGLDIGPSSLAVVSQQGQAHLTPFCEELKPDRCRASRLQRKMDRQRHALNPGNYDECGRVKTGRLRWQESKNYQKIRRRHATSERKLAAHRKSLHGRLVNTIVGLGNTITIEKTSFRGWQKTFGKSVGLRAPGMFYERLKRTVAKTGGIITEVSAFKTRLSQYCHACKTYVKKPLRQRWHHCVCGVGPVQRDLYSAALLAHLNPKKHIPSISQDIWAGLESSLTAEMERLQQRANGGYSLPSSFGITRVRVRQQQSPGPERQEPSFLYRRGRLEALELAQEPSHL